MKSLNLKNMIEMYYRAYANEKVWDAFYQMYLLGFISFETWDKFIDACGFWVYDKEKRKIITTFDNKVVEI